MLSRLIIFAFLGISLGFRTSSNIRVFHTKSVLNSYNNENINEVFEPFKDLNFLSTYNPSSTLNDDKKIINKACNGMEYNKVLPAMSLLAILGFAGDADAVDLDVIDAPLQGIALYSR